jgi:OmpA-OmpF porin, OOP family
MYQKKNLIRLTTLFCLVSASALGASDRVKGMITTRTGETLIVKSDKGNVTVVLTDSTKTKDDMGLLGLGTEQLADVVLIPGLKVDVEGTSDDQGRIVASTITVDGDDLEASEMIQAGLHPTAEQVAANMKTLLAHMKAIEAGQQNVAANKARIEELERRLAAADRPNTQHQIAANIPVVEDTTHRFTALADYEVKGETTVKFDTGSSTLTPEDEELLKKLAETAKAQTGYIIEVTGYADSTGSAAINTKLSEDRAKSVITLLIQQGGVPVRHIVAPGAMGEYGATASNETEAGRAENRRVEVKILVNKGIAGK